MDITQSNIDKRFIPKVIKKSNVLHHYYAVNSVDGHVLNTGVNISKLRVIWRRLVTVFNFIILNYQDAKWKINIKKARRYMLKLTLP